MLQNNNRYKVLKVFLDSSITEFGLREISRKIGLALPSVKNYLLELEDKDLVEKKEVRGSPVYVAVRDSERFKVYMKLSIQYELFESGIIDFVWENISPEAIILYGGYSKGEAIGSSDIDLFAIGKRQDINLTKYEKLLGKEVHLIVDEINKIPKELKNNLVNGIVLRGYFKVLR